MVDEENRDDETGKPIEVVYMRDFSKVIFFYPLFMTSLILWIIQLVIQSAAPWVGLFWLIIFFMNLFVIAFDVSSQKFLILVLLIAVIIILVIFVMIPNYHLLPIETIENAENNITMSTNFYLSVVIILGIILGIAIIDTRLNYWKMERNEIYHKRGIFTSADRYPTRSLRMKVDINDVFELLMLRAGSITLTFSKREIFHLNTVLNVSKKQKQIDFLMSHVEIEIDDLV